MVKTRHENALAWTALRSTPGLGPKRLAELALALGERHMKANDLFGAQVEELQSLGLSKVLAGRAVRALSDLPKSDPAPPGSVLLTPDDPAYPIEQLDPGLPLPVVLYATGNVELLHRPGVAISGSRSATGRALEVAARVARWAAESGLNVVSGHASGVDETAHEAALAAGGTTTAVLAEGILRFSPRRGLRDADPESLLFLSGFRPAAKWTVYQAMERNKWIAALSSAVVVVASNLRGGSWAQGVLCLQVGKPLLVPDLPEEDAPGNRELIQRGARPLEPEDPESGMEGFLAFARADSTEDQTTLFG